MAQTRFNQLLIEEFNVGDKLISIGEPLTLKAWDRIIHCANLAADRFAAEIAREAIERAADWKVMTKDSLHKTKIILK